VEPLGPAQRRGRRLFEDQLDKTELNLVETTTLPNGVVVYQHAE
jgi:hypothetical protein